MHPSWFQEVTLWKDDFEEVGTPRSEEELLCSTKRNQRVLHHGCYEQQRRYDQTWIRWRLIGFGVAALGGVACTATVLRGVLGGHGAIWSHGALEVIAVEDLISEIASDKALGNDKIQIVCTVSWKAHPEKCWDYSHRLPSHPKPHPGMQLSIWDCLKEPDKFVVPVKGAGPIKVAGHDKLSLDSPGGAQLQFWECANTKKSHIEFIRTSLGCVLTGWHLDPMSAWTSPTKIPPTGTACRCGDVWTKGMARICTSASMPRCAASGLTGVTGIGVL